MPINILLIAVGVILGICFMLYALYQVPKERVDGGPYPKVILPGDMK